MSPMFRWLDIRNSIQKKIFVSFLLVVILPTAIISVSSYYFSVDLLKRKVSESFLDNLVYNKNIIVMEFKQFEQIADYIGSNPNIGKALSPDFQPYTANGYYGLQDAQQTLQNFTIQSNISFIEIFGENGVILFTGSGEVIYPWVKYKQFTWYQQAIQSDKAHFWFGATDNAPGLSMPSEDGYSPSMIKSFRDNTTLERLGVIYIRVNSDLFDNIFTNSNINKGGKFTVIDSQGRIIYHPDQSMLLQAFPNMDNLKAQKNESGYFVTEDGQLMVYYYIDQYGWWLTDSIPLNVLLKDNKAIFKITIAVFLICFLISGIIWHFVSSGIVRPVKELAALMRSVKNGGLTVKSNYQGEDEIGLLSTSFNYMIEKIQELFDRMLEEQSKKKDMEYQSLQAQINPHFLYNTLNSIRWMAIIQKVDNIKEMIEALGRLLENCTSRSDSMITIAEELAIVKDYIKIHEIKYPDKFEVLYEIDEDLLQVKCIKFILQPFVENAIFHGIEPKNGTGMIRICVKRVGRDVEILVYDDGVGMDGDQLHSILKHERENIRRFNGIGIMNVNERLRLTFGETYGIRIDSKKNSHTSICIRFPIS